MASKTTKAGTARRIKDTAARGLSGSESKQVRGGKKLPGKRTPPTVVLH
jgi:hypothetical protein